MKVASSQVPIVAYYTACAIEWFAECARKRFEPSYVCAIESRPKHDDSFVPALGMSIKLPVPSHRVNVPWDNSWGVLLHVTVSLNGEIWRHRILRLLVLVSLGWSWTSGTAAI